VNEPRNLAHFPALVIALAWGIAIIVLSAG